MTESEIQKAVIDHLESRGVPEIFFWHNSAHDGRQRPGGGVRRGMPDLMIVRRNESGGQLYGLELKAPHGAVSAQQIRTMEALKRAGAIVAFKFGLDDALKWLEQNELVRRGA